MVKRASKKRLFILIRPIAPWLLHLLIAAFVVILPYEIDTFAAMAHDFYIVIAKTLEILTPTVWTINPFEFSFFIVFHELILIRYLQNMATLRTYNQ